MRNEELLWFLHSKNMIISALRSKAAIIVNCEL